MNDWQWHCGHWHFYADRSSIWALGGCLGRGYLVVWLGPWTFNVIRDDWPDL